MLILLFLFALFRHLQGAPLTADEGGGIADLLPAVHILPRAHVVFVNRTTSEIVISCLATIFACTWTSIHPNIPSPADSRWNIFKRRLVTTIYAVLTPEFITIWALKQHLGAKRIMKEYNTEFSKRKPSITADVEQQCHSRQSFFQKLQLGMKKFGVGIEKWLFSAPPFNRAKECEIQPWTTTHGFFVQMGGFMLCENGRPIQTLSFALLKKQIQGNAIKAPRITQAEIEDRSKGDIISKTLVILQTTWFIAQCIARWSANISVTELEIVTLAFAMLNGFTYTLWWNKPQNVGVPVYLDIKAPLTDSESLISQAELAIESRIIMETTQSSHTTQELDLLLTDLTDAKLHKQSYFRQNFTRDWNSSPSRGIQLLFVIPYRLLEAVVRPISKITNPDFPYVCEGDLRVGIFFADVVNDNSHFGVMMIAISLVTALFGCVHLVPGFFLHYHSSTEMWLWRISAAFITVQPPFTALMALYEPKMKSPFPNWANFIIYLFMEALFPLYGFFRLTLIALAFISLRDLPPNAHLTIDWISSIPHL